MDDTAATVSTPADVLPSCKMPQSMSSMQKGHRRRRRKQELLVPQQELLCEPTLTTSTVASYDSLQRPQQYLQVVTPVSTALQGEMQQLSAKASTPQLSARTRVIYDQSTLPRPHEVQTVLATPPRQLRSPAAVYATPLLPGQATPPPPHRGRLPETAPVYARREISAFSSATPPHPYVRTASAREPSNALAPLTPLTPSGEVVRSDAFPLGLASGYVDTGGTADFTAGSLCLTSEGREVSRLLNGYCDWL
ncbi:unnamed protein product [Symbiodinium sp. KB8]|nr:unnamed protein product [Symbiodinium sp. KB8]